MKNLSDIEERIDYTAYCLNLQAEDLFSAMQELRHNAPELFRRHLSEWKESFAEITNLNQRISAMANIVEIESRLN